MYRQAFQVAGATIWTSLESIIERLSRLLPNTPLQPTSGGHAPGEGGSMGSAARG